LKTSYCIMDSLRFLAQYDKDWRRIYRFLVATKINQDSVDCKRAILLHLVKLVTTYVVFQGRRKLFSIGGRRKFLNLESLKCHFLDFGEYLTEFWWSENSVLVCWNLQFSSTIYRISCRKVWVISSFFAVCHGLNDKGLHDFEKKMTISKLLGGGCSAPGPPPPPGCYGPVFTTARN
jgi:hypothetical protein